jgi:SPP1 gp7 family putative phage head morphogenesis protein
MNAGGRVLELSKADLSMLERLSAFIDEESPELAEFLTRTWDDQQKAITYRELREAIFNGEISKAQILNWQQDYSVFVSTVYAPVAEKAINKAAMELAQRFGGLVHDPQTFAMRQFIESRGAQLVREMSAAQTAAINTIVKQASLSGTLTVNECARAIRPCIGLTKRQTQATYNFYEKLRELGVPPKTALKRQATYAEMTHRNRAETIAQTEMGRAYNEGAAIAVQEGQQQGLFGKFKERWLTAEDERVCPQCGALHGVTIEQGGTFPGGIILPPAHPRCRCAVAYDIEPIEETGGVQFTLQEIEDLYNTYMTAPFV